MPNFHQDRGGRGELVNRVKAPYMPVELVKYYNLQKALQYNLELLK